MYVKVDMNIEELISHCWNGADRVAIRVKELGLEKELFSLMNDIFDGVTPELEEVNEFLRCEVDYIAKTLNIKPYEL